MFGVVFGKNTGEIPSISTMSPSLCINALLVANTILESSLFLSCTNTQSTIAFGPVTVNTDAEVVSPQVSITIHDELYD